MIEEQTQISMLNINTTLKTLSIAIDEVALKNGKEIARERDMSAFVPGQIDAVKAFTGWDDSTPEIIYLNSVWTQDVIDAYQLLLNQGN